MRITISIANLDLRGIDRIRDKIDNSKFARAGAETLAMVIQRHLSSLNRHKTIDWLNRRSKTQAHSLGRYRNAAGDVHLNVGTGATDVIIPLPGISRAFHALEIAPRTASILTIPINSIAYGKRAGQLRAEGWKLFRGKGKGKHILFGAYNGERLGLYALKDRVRVPQDRTLLPSDQQISSAVQRGAQQYINSLNGQ